MTFQCLLLVAPSPPAPEAYQEDIFIMVFCSLQGESNHKGFYAYDNKYKAHPDPKILRYIKIARNKYSGTINSKVSLLLSGFTYPFRFL